MASEPAEFNRSESVRVQANGLLSFTGHDGVRRQDLAADEVVRLWVKQVRAAAVSEALASVNRARRSHPSVKEPPKCPRCGSPRPNVRRSMIGVSGSCDDSFHSGRTSQESK